MYVSPSTHILTISLDKCRQVNIKITNLYHRGFFGIHNVHVNIFSYLKFCLDLVVLQRPVFSDTQRVFLGVYRSWGLVQIKIEDVY